MFEAKKIRKRRIIFGIALMLAGVLLAYILIKTAYDNCAYEWINNINGFGRKYASIGDCFISRSKAWILLSVSLGFIPFCYGCTICKK